MSGLAAPSWLAEEAEICALLHAVLDRFDAQPGSERQRPICLAAEKLLPSLQSGDAGADQSWALMCQLVAMNVCTVRAPRRGLYDPAWSGSKLAFAPESEPILRSWLGRAASEPALQAWRQAVRASAGMFLGDLRALLARRIVIQGRSDQQVLAALARVAAIPGPVSLRQLSAQSFWGNSKVLDGRGDLIAALFPELQLRERPLVAAIHLPLVTRGVLFIENQDTYALAVEGAFASTADLALVYGAGFRSTATRIRSRSGALLHFAGPGLETTRAAFEQWWHEESTASLESWFWGDLDFAGMQILKSCERDSATCERGVRATSRW